MVRAFHVRRSRTRTTIYFDLHERTLRYEVYFLPLPPVPTVALYEYLLRRNHTMYGARFLARARRRHLPRRTRSALEHLTEDELDRIIGVLYELTEQWFQPVVALAYGKRAEPAPEPGGNAPLHSGGPGA